ncbi:MAG TPA: hypothetical protein VML55_06025, partial [Planctomycetaceae bacterium]|nr:hypothetical protein [Planctomycetaceae bacterium]
MVLTLAVAWASLLSAGELVAAADAGDEQRTSTTCGSPAIDAGSARAVQAILEAGFSGPSVDPAAIERLAAAAGKTGERDSRVEYARGLVLLKHLKHREAVAAFDSATRAGPPCLPAWQALVRSRLTLKEGDAALALAEQLAAQLTDANAAWPNACRSEAATWLGRLAGYLALDGVELVQPPAVLTAHEVRMRLSLGEGLAEAYAAGRANVHREHQGLLKQRALARTEIAADQQKQSQDRTAAVAEERAE